MTDWNRVTDNSVPDLGQEVYYYSDWIGVWRGVYKGKHYCEFDEESYHHFVGDGGVWDVDTPTWWLPLWGHIFIPHPPDFVEPKNKVDKT